MPSGASCSQRFAYEWDEIGRLTRARRWDGASPGAASGPVPSGAPAVELRYAYDAEDDRVLKTASGGAGDVYTVYPLASLELRRTTWDGSDYERSAWTEVPYLFAHGVRLARLHYADSSVPSVRSPASSQVHVLFELADHLGSSSIVVDKETSELVERSTYQPYGGGESDYRTDRWDSFREDYRFTGKEEDVEVGLQYFGKRYLSAALNRWMSADPLEVHSPGSADINLYSYVHGAVFTAVDPTGLIPDNADTITKSFQQSSSLASIANPDVSARMFASRPTRPSPAPSSTSARWSRSAEWQVDATSSAGVDTGSTAANVVVNKILLPWANLGGWALNRSLQTLQLGTDAAESGARSIGFSSHDIEAARLWTGVPGAMPSLSLTMPSLLRTAAPARGAMASSTGAGRALSSGTIARMTRAVENRMRAVGVPEKAIGIYREPAFNPVGKHGGMNVVGVGIEVDAGVFGTMDGYEAFSRARLSTRVDAVIAHEFAEFQGAEHAVAVEIGPNSPLSISQAARDLLLLFPK